MMLNDPQGFKDIHQMMQDGFGNLNMAKKNKLKDFMKKQAPFLADIFNMYKDQGMAVPVHNAFRGQKLKQIKDLNNLIQEFRNRGVGGSAGAGGEKSAIPPVKQRAGTEKFKAGDNVYSKLESDFVNNALQNQIDRGAMEGADRAGINGTHLVNKGSANEMYYKPDAENRFGDIARSREVMAYEITKLLGVEGLVPPTKT